MNQKGELTKCLLLGIHHKESYPETVCEFCIGLHFSSPRAYEFVRSTFQNNLPHPGTVRSWYANSDIDVKPGINAKSLEILKKKEDEMRRNNGRLLCTLIFDEMSIRQHVQWCDKTKRILGHVDLGDGRGTQSVAKQALVFMVNAVNTSFQLPVATFFIETLNAIERKDLLNAVVNRLSECGVILMNVTCDGLVANKSMFSSNGASFGISSKSFRPYFTTDAGHKIYVNLDACHMQKLIRNTLASKGELFDDKNKAIEWKYFELLVNKTNQKNMTIVHKLSQKHLDWKRKIMNVEIACQTLSETTANALQFCKDQKFEEFSDVGATIRFIRIFNRLFDIFNTKSNSANSDKFKKPIDIENEREIFEFLKSAAKYIKCLKIKSNDGSIKSIITSRSRTGFVGYITDIYSLISVFEYYVKNKKYTSSISTYSFSQDHLEIFFGKIRSLNGFNDNPTVQQFLAASRKLLANSTIMYLKDANCKVFHCTNNPYSNVLYVSSRRSKSGENEIPDQSEVDAVLEKYEEITKLFANEDNFNDYAIGHVANIIENKIKTTDRLYCIKCKGLFDCEEKEIHAFIDPRLERKPCRSTVQICKQADSFLKLRMLERDLNINAM